MITRDEIRHYLGDRQWHTGIELVRHFSPLIPPEQASHEFYSARKKSLKAVSEIPLEAVVRKGAELVVSRLLTGLTQAGLIEVGGGHNLTEKKFRWTAWHCWLCGTQVRTSLEMSDSGLCPTCEDAVQKTEE